MHCEPIRNRAELIALDEPRDAEPEPSSLAHFSVPMQRLMADSTVTEICINRPGEAYVERSTGWTWEVIPYASYHGRHALAKLCANFTIQRVYPSVAPF